MLRRALILALVLLFSACSSTPPSGTGSLPPATGTTPPAPTPDRRPEQDGTPLYREGMDRIPDAIPRFEPITDAGNKSPYTVLGETYRIERRPYGYRQSGVASWYGTKFHGANTSNGEPYDVYAMSAAHKTLPIPCYVRVRNLDNGRSIVVRINDRGPFKHGRIIDLSYAAAYKLGYADRGTARVELELLDPGAEEWVVARARDATATPMVSTTAGPMWVQVGAFGSESAARLVRENVIARVDSAVTISPVQSGDTTLYRVRIGPILDPQLAFKTQHIIEQAQLGSGRIVTQ